MAQEKAAKAEEHLKEISMLFKKLKVIYKNLQPIPNVNDDQGGLLLDIDMTEVSGALTHRGSAVMHLRVIVLTFSSLRI